MKKVYLLCVLFLLKITLSAQVQSVSVQAIQSCGGATLVPFVIWSGTPVPVTINYERQGAAGTWFTVVSQVYVVGSSYMVVGPTDISTATNYRIRAVDGNFQEFISNGAVVNPATWNVNRGAANVTVNTYWGTSCSNNDNFSQVSINYLANGRPPFRVEYNTQSNPNFILAGEVVGFINILGIVPNTGYSIRVTDYCGNVSNTATTLLQFLSASSVLQDATTCNDGRITLGPTGDQRYWGIPPYEYGIGKMVAGLGGNLPTFVYQATPTFENLGPGHYYLRVRDQCGNLSTLSSETLGGGFPTVSGTFSLPANGDSCSRNITVNATNGDGPFEYSIRYIQDAQFGPWQTSNLFTNLTRSGVWFIRAKDKCGQESDAVAVNIGVFPSPVIDSIRHTNVPGCAQSIQVFASGGLKPYEYSRNFFDWKTTDTFNNLQPGIYAFWVRDRCGRTTLLSYDTIPIRDLTVHISSGLDSCGASTAYLSIDSVVNGTAPFVYAIRNMAAPGTQYTPFMSDTVFHNLPPGEYSVWVKDACYAEKIIDFVKVGSAFTYTWDLTPNINCSPFLTVNLHNALAGPYTYFITNGLHKRKIETSDSTVSLTELPNGDYTITVTNTCGDTAVLVGGPLTITNSGTPQITYEVQYVNGCLEANIIVHGAPPGSRYQLFLESGASHENTDGIFLAADLHIQGGKHLVVVINENFCNDFYFYQDSVVVNRINFSPTGTVNPNLPDSFCVYNTNTIRLSDYLLGAVPGGSWTSTAPAAFDATTTLFNPSVAGEGSYEFTYSLVDACGTLHETTVQFRVGPEACEVRALIGDYHSITQPQGCPEITGGFQNIEYMDNKGSLLFGINPLGRDLSSVCAGVRIRDGNGTSLRSAVINGRVTYFLDRNFYIQSPNGFSGGGAVTIMLYITDEEMQNMITFLQNNGYPTAGVGDLRILQKSGDDEDLDVINEGAVDPLRFVVHTPITYQSANFWIMQFEVHNFSEFIPHFTGAPVSLPLRLIDFTGTFRQNQVRLQWKTADENNTAHFDIERSGDGNIFQSIGRLSASGNSAAEKLYTFNDAQPFTGNNFYRLKMVDIDGKYTYSNTIKLRGEKLTGMKLTPNPAKDHLYISIPENTRAKAIRIYDASGRLLYQERPGGNQLLRVSTAQLRNGWYMLELQTDQGILREAFLKQ